MKIANIFDKVILVLAATIIFYIGIILYSDFTNVWNEENKLTLEYLPLIILLMIAHTVISSLKFHRLLNQLKIQISFKESLKIFLAGLSLALTPGGIGTAIKSRILKKQYGKSISSTIPIIFIERWTELIAIVVIISFLLLWVNFIESIIVIGFGILFILIFGILSSHSKTFISIKKLFTKIKYFQKLTDSIDESYESFQILTKKRNLFEISLISISTKIIHLITVYLIFMSVGINIGFFESGQIYYTSLLIGNLSLIPAGVIVTETGMIAMLVSNGINFSLASLGVIFMRFIGTWIPAITGIIMYHLAFREKMKS